MILKQIKERHALKYTALFLLIVALIYIIYLGHMAGYYDPAKARFDGWK